MSKPVELSPDARLIVNDLGAKALEDLNFQMK